MICFLSFSLLLTFTIFIILNEKDLASRTMFIGNASSCIYLSMWSDGPSPIIKADKTWIISFPGLPNFNESWHVLHTPLSVRKKDSAVFFCCCCFCCVLSFFSFLETILLEEATTKLMCYHFHHFTSHKIAVIVIAGVYSHYSCSSVQFC